MIGKRSNKALVVLATGAFLFLAFVYVAFSKYPTIYTVRGETMGTTWSVQVSSADSAALITIEDELRALLLHLDEDVYSTWAPQSELSRLNRSPPGQNIGISSELMSVLSMSKTLHVATGGAFDITIGTLVNLWGFGPVNAQAAIPDGAAIESGRQDLGISALALDEQGMTVLKQKSLTLDLSAIAKGYAVDRAAGLLAQSGYMSYLVEIGGEIRARGLRPDGQPWLIAIEAPLANSRIAYAAIANYGEAIAVAGSGDYRNFREIGGTRYSHEIDPRTGYPIAHDLAAVTVIADSAARADAWSTALMVLGPKEGKALADSENLAAYFIMRDGAALEHIYTAAFARFLYPRQGI